MNFGRAGGRAAVMRIIILSQLVTWTYYHSTFIRSAPRHPQVKGKLEYVARGVSRLMNLAVGDQKVWAVIETTALDPGHRRYSGSASRGNLDGYHTWRAGYRILRA